MKNVSKHYKFTVAKFMLLLPCPHPSQIFGKNRTVSARKIIEDLGSNLKKNGLNATQWLSTI